MSTLTRPSIAEILKAGQIYLETITPNSKTIEITIGDYTLTGDLYLRGYMTKADHECGIPAEYKVTEQKIVLTELLDEEGEAIEFNQVDIDVINAWFQSFSLEVFVSDSDVAENEYEFADMLRDRQRENNYLNN